MNYLKQHKRLIIFILASIFFLLAFDIFNEVSKRGDLSSRILPRVFRVLLLFVFSLFFFRISKGSKNKFNQIIILIYLTILLYMFFDSNLGFDTLISMSKLLYLFFSYLFFFKFYLLFYNHQTIRYLNLFVMLSVFILTFHIVGSRLNLIEVETTVKTYGYNNGYILLSFLPLIYINTNLKFRKILILILTIGVLLSLKRGAMLALLFCLLADFFIGRKVNKINTLSKLKNFFNVFLALTLLFFIYSEFSDMFNERFEDFYGESESFGSGRGNIYSLIWNDWLESNNIITYIFGKGYDSVKVLTSYINGSGLMAHSDFFNFIHSYGLFGIFLLVLFTFHQFRVIFRLYILKHKLVIPYITLFIIFLFKAIYSGNFESPNFIYLLIGFAIFNASLTNLRIKI